MTREDAVRMVYWLAENGFATGTSDEKRATADAILTALTALGEGLREARALREALLWVRENIGAADQDDVIDYCDGVLAASHALAAPASAPEKCEECGWPLADSADKGCTRGNCSMRCGCRERGEPCTHRKPASAPAAMCDGGGLIDTPMDELGRNAKLCPGCPACRDCDYKGDTP